MIHTPAVTMAQHAFRAPEITGDEVGDDQLAASSGTCDLYCEASEPPVSLDLPSLVSECGLPWFTDDPYTLAIGLKLRHKVILILRTVKVFDVRERRADFGGWLAGWLAG